MGFLLRQLCATLVFIVLIRYSQTFLRIGKRTLDDSPLVLESTEFGNDGLDEYNQLQKRQSFLRIGRGFLRIGRGPFLRIGKRDLEKRFLRIGRSGFLRIGRAPREDIRLARNPLLTGNQERSLTDEEIQFLRENRELLLQLLEKQPELRLHLSDDSFYFPRMGRSGENTQLDDTDYCCAEGVRSVTTIGKGEFEMCPRDQSCCSGMTERTKLYKGIIITECIEEMTDNSLEKMRAYLEED